MTEAGSKSDVVRLVCTTFYVVAPRGVREASIHFISGDEYL